MTVMFIGIHNGFLFSYLGCSEDCCNWEIQLSHIFVHFLTQREGIHDKNIITRNIQSAFLVLANIYKKYKSTKMK